MGGQWCGPAQVRAPARVRDVGLRLYPTYDEGRHTVEWRGKLIRHGGRLPWLGAATLADIGLAQYRLDHAARRLDTTAPWTAVNASRLDGQTFAQWMARNVKTSGGEKFFRLVTEAVFSAEPEDLSALWTTFYVGSAGGLDALSNTRKGAQQDRVVGGSQLIALGLAARLGSAVHTDCEVVGIDWSADRVTVTAADERVFTARRAVLAVPPPLAGRIATSPEMPEVRRALVEGMPMGSVIKVNVVYGAPFWREEGLSGQANSV